MYKTTKCRRADSLTNKIKSAVMLLMLFVSFGSYAQYCEVSTDWAGDYLSSITISNALQNISYTATSQPAGSYADQTDQVIMQSQGLSFDISTTYVGGSNGVNVWIDFDGDEEFDDSEKVFSENGANDHSGTINIPIDVAIGEYRMRVRGQWGSTANPPPCGSVSYGSTVDFTLSVIEAPDCMPPSGINAVEVTDSTAEIEWAAPTDQDTWFVYITDFGNPAPDDTTTDYEIATSSPYTIDDLDPSTQYDIYVKSDCGTDGQSFWTGPLSIYTTQVPAQMPFEEDFEGTVEWTLSSGTQTNQWVVGDAVGNDDNSLYISNDQGDTHAYTNTSTTVAHAFRDIQIPTDSESILLSFDWMAQAESCCDYIRVWVVPADFIPTPGTQISVANSGGVQFGGNFNQQNAWTNQFYEIPSTDYAGEIVRLVFEWRNDGSVGTQPPGAIDNVEVSEITCPTPTELGTVNTTVESIEIEWTAPDSQDSWEVLTLTQGSDAPDETTTGYEEVSDNPYTVEGLDSNTAYDIYVRANCGSDGTSSWVMISAMTNCEAFTVPFWEGFNSDSTTEQCWTILNLNGDGDQWDTNYTSNPYEGNQSAMLYTDINGGNNDDWLISPQIDLTNTLGAARLKFHYRVQSAGEPNDFRVMLSTTGSNPDDFTTELLPVTEVNNITYQEMIINLDDDTGGALQQEVFIAFHVPEGGLDGWRLYIDNVIVEPYNVNCPDPTELDAEILSMTEADLSWTSDGDLFDIEWGEAGFDQGDGTTVTDIDETTYNLDNLTPDTEYEFYVRQDCGADGESFWSGPYLFFTGYCEATSTYTSDHITAFSTSGAIMNIDNPSGSPGSPNGYANYSSMVVAHYETGEIEFTVTNSISMGINIWVDWNNNLEFEESEKVYASGVTANNFSGSFSVPAGTPLGNYRMRLRGQWGNSNPQPCGNISWGETEDYTLTVIDPPACMPPSQVNIIQVTDDSLELGWTAPAEQDAWQVLVLPAGSPAPDEDTTGWIATTENPFTVEGLDPATEYDAYVRADCSSNDDGVSLWAGPASATTTQIAADVDFEDDFEGESGWTFTNENQTNQWHVGTATSYQGSSSLYISNDNGNTNAYTISSAATVTHAIRDLAFPDNTNEATISFWWKARGEGTTYVYDYMRVWLMPSTFQPTSGTLITDVEGGIQLGDNFNNQEEWEQFFELLDLSQFAGQTGRLIFEWRNDGGGGTQPPAAVDNVEVKLVTCSRPIEVTVEKNQVTGNLLATWTPVAGETQWEVIVQAADEPAPDETTTGEIVNQPQYLIEDVVEGEFYKIYVRAICDEDDKSLWTEGVDFSDFNPPACANIDMDFPDLTIDEQGDFIFCAADGQLTLDLVADFDDSMFKSTTSYEVEQIDYAPPFPFLGGIEMPITADDDYTASFELPFNFCFFGNEYSYCRIGDNGVVTFGLPYTTTYGEYCPWTLNGPIPSPTFSIKNAIYGVFQDMLTTNNPGPDSQINYQVLGTYPCRALVVNFNEVPAFGGSCSGEQYRTTTQIVLYEITNIIEIYVANRTACSGWQSGLGVLGIQNEDGTVAYTPPGRNTGAWDAVEEAWRFTPNGETTVDFGWYVNGEFYSDNPVDQIIVTEDTCIEARVSYPGCGGDDLVLSKEYCVKVAPEIVLDQPEDIKVCLIDGEYEPINLTDKIPEAIDTLSQIENFDLADYDISFYLNQSAADAKNNPIPNPESYVPTSLPQTVWVRVEHESTGCYGLTSFDIYQGVGLDLNRPDNVVLCVYFDIIPETDLSRVNEQLLANINDTDGLIVNYYHSQQDAIYGSNPIQNWANFEAPSLSYEIWIKVSGSEEICESITSFMLLEGIGLPEYEHPDFDICTGYVLPMLPDGYFYTSEYLAEGEHIQPGTVIKTPGVHTIYVNIISDEGCITSSSYNVNIIECAVPRGISPNGDGLNDNFDLSDYFLVDLKIFNRDGREVYSHGMGYTNEWEGQSNSGNLLPDGTYYYRIVTPVEELTGWVQLVRETR